MIPLSQFPKEALDWAFDQVKDRGDWNSQTIRDLADQYLKTNFMKADPRAPIMGSVTFNPNRLTEGDLHAQAIEDLYSPKDSTEFAKEWKGCFLDRFDQPMSFRDFLRLKKEVLEAFNEWRSKQAIVDLMRTVIAMEPEPWPESLQGLTREDIEVLKM